MVAATLLVKRHPSSSGPQAYDDQPQRGPASFGDRPAARIAAQRMRLVQHPRLQRVDACSGAGDCDRQPQMRPLARDGRSGSPCRSQRQAAACGGTPSSGTAKAPAAGGKRPRPGRRLRVSRAPAEGRIEPPTVPLAARRRV